MFGETPLVIVETTDALAAAVARLRESPVLGVDTESDSFHHYQEKVCLLQISDLERDYIIDPLQVRDLSALGPLMADPGITKIFHGADYDVVSLKRDFGFTFRNIFDTMIAAQFLHLPGVGLADLIRRWFGHVIDKKWQRHDWASRPLLTEHLQYARGDTHFLPSLREILERRLSAVGKLDHVREECVVMEGREWQGRTHDPNDFLRVKGSSVLADAEKRVLRTVYAYRDSEARNMDRPAFKVIPDPVLLEIARAQPQTADAVTDMMRKGSSLARRHGSGLAEAVRNAVGDDSPLPAGAPRAPKGPPDALRAKDAERLMGLLKDWRNRLVGKQNAAPVTVASNNLLREIVRLAPTTVEELAEVPDIRQWQLSTHGEALVEIVRIVAGAPEGDSGDDSEAGSGLGRRRKRRRGTRKAGSEADAEAGEPVVVEEAQGAE